MLGRIQADAAEQGYADEVAAMPITFDPEYDTAERLREFGSDRGVDFDAGNWFFLRPEGPERADEVVNETFGVGFERTESGDDQEGEGDDDQSDTESDDEDGMPFAHLSLILLANAAGYVERAYVGGPGSLCRRGPGRRSGTRPEVVACGTENPSRESRTPASQGVGRQSSTAIDLAVPDAEAVPPVPLDRIDAPGRPTGTETVPERGRVSLVVFFAT